MENIEKIKKGLECRIRGTSEKCKHHCDEYDFYIRGYSLEKRYSDVLAYIKYLEDRNEKLENALRNLANSSSNARDAANKVIEHLESRLKQVKRERDAAVHDIKEIVQALNEPACQWCADTPFCDGCAENAEMFEWRGVCSENTKEEIHES